MKTKDQIKKIEKLERELSKICREHYETCVGAARRLTPRYPWILVRTLPKDHITSGGILLPDTEQNKPMYEGIVIAVWKPWIEYRYKTISQSDATDLGFKVDKAKETLAIQHECDVIPGERICFPHFAGTPLFGYLDDKYYRLLALDDRQGPRSDAIMRIDYEGDYELAAELREITSKFYSVTTSGVAASRRMIDL